MGCDNWMIKRHYIKVSNITTGLNSLENNIKTHLIPNPSSEECAIQFSSLISGESKLEVSIYNYSGQFESEIFNGRSSDINKQKLIIDTRALENGIYFVKTTINYNISIRKLIVLH
jgi:hypothetical protein